MTENQLSPEDQAHVDEFLSTGIHSVERKPFRPIKLLLVLMVIVSGFSILSIVIARMAGVY
ncbi:MAG: hypothetical protein ACI9GW_002822 [Halieaceae bacterium]